MDKKHRIHKGRHITVVGNDYIRSVVEMILEHYDTAERNGTLFIIWPPFGFHDKEITYKQYGNYYFIDLAKMKQSCKHLVFYDLEHTANSKFDWIDDEYLEPADEIWTPWIENLGCYGKNNDKAVFMPVRACTFLKERHVDTVDKPFYAGGFFGFMTDYRKQVLHQLLANPMSPFDPNGYVIVGVNQYEVPDLMKNTKFVIDLTQRWREDVWTQNVVRCFEAICMGKHVISDKSTFNYFPDMVTEMEEPFSRIFNIVKTTEVADHSQEFWDMTYSDGAFDQYKADCLERYKNENIALPIINVYYDRFKRLVNVKQNDIYSLSQ